MIYPNFWVLFSIDEPKWQSGAEDKFKRYNGQMHTLLDSENQWCGQDCRSQDQDLNIPSWSRQSFQGTASLNNTSQSQKSRLRQKVARHWKMSCGTLEKRQYTSPQWTHHEHLRYQRLTCSAKHKKNYFSWNVKWTMIYFVEQL